MLMHRSARPSNARGTDACGQLGVPLGGSVRGDALCEDTPTGWLARRSIMVGSKTREPDPPTARARQLERHGLDRTHMAIPRQE